MEIEAFTTPGLRRVSAFVEELQLAMAFGVGRSVAAPLLLINFVLYLMSACLAGWALNRNVDATVGKGAGPVGK